jgi:hypothetical protein
MKKLIAIAALMCGTAHAEFYTGNDLLAKMQSSNSDERIHALGYVMGVFDVGAGVVQCAPENVTAGQARDMVRNYLDNTPATRHLNAEAQVRYVLSTAWPCPKRNKGTAL